MDDDQIQKSITVKIEERATRTPTGVWRKQPPLLGLVLEPAIAEIPIENVLSPLGDEQIRIPMIVYVSDTDPLSPSGGLDSRLLSNVFEFQPAQIVIKEMLRRDRACPERSCVDQKNVGQPVIIKVDDRDAVAGGLYNV